MLEITKSSTTKSYNPTITFPQLQIIQCIFVQKQKQKNNLKKSVMLPSFFTIVKISYRPSYRFYWWVGGYAFTEGSGLADG